jgi:hypothetical protein
MGARSAVDGFIRARSDPSYLGALLTLSGEILGWGDVDVDEFFDRGHGPTGLRFYRGAAQPDRRFMNMFPGRSLQFRHVGGHLSGLNLVAEQDPKSGYLILPVSALRESLDEARLLASFGYWAVRQ